MDENNPVLHKIKRCLALSKSSNEHEASTALRQAHILMSKYSITLDDIRLSVVNESNSDTKASNKPNLYKTNLAHLIARKFSCKIYLGGEWSEVDDKFTRKITFVGIDIYPKIASYAYDVLIRQLEKSRREYMQKHLTRVKIKENKYQRADAFCFGWISTVEKLIDNLIPPDVDSSLIENKIKSLTLGKAKSLNRVKDVDGKLSLDYCRGKEDGKTAYLHNAMNGNESRNHIGMN